MLNEQQTIEYAIKGINADIEKLERSVRRGKQLLEDIARGLPTEKSEQEIKDIIRKKKSEIDSLVKLESDLQWKLLDLKGELD